MLQYSKEEGVSEGGSLIVSHTSKLGDTEIITIRCINCTRLLFRMQHNIGDGILLHHDLQSFLFKAYCSECDRTKSL